jgi:hypothetical protein
LSCAEANFHENENFNWDSDEEDATKQVEESSKPEEMDGQTHKAGVENEDAVPIAVVESRDAETASDPPRDSISEGPAESEGTDSFEVVPSRVDSTTSISRLGKTEDDKRDDWEEWE